MLVKFQVTIVRHSSKSHEVELNNSAGMADRDVAIVIIKTKSAMFRTRKCRQLIGTDNVRVVFALASL